MKKKGYLFVLMAAMCWATLGLFGNTLMSLGLIPEQVAFLRLFVGFLILTIYALIKNPTILKINKKGFIFALLVGLVCQAGFNMFYFNYVKTIGVSLSTVLVYTSPLFIALFSRIIYKEKIDKMLKKCEEILREEDKKSKGFQKKSTKQFKGKIIIREDTEKYDINQKHDKMFKEMLSDKKSTVDFINSFLHLNLVEDDIEKYEKEFRTSEFSNVEADVVYKIKNKNVFILIEHQSSVDYKMSYRIMRYKYAIIESAIDKKRLKEKSYRIPMVIPIVLYTGKRKWQKLLINDIEEKVEGYAENWLGYTLIDVNEFSKEELLADNLIITKAMLIEKSKNKEELYRNIEEVINIQKEKKAFDNLQLEKLITYELSETEDKNIMHEFIEKIRNIEGSEEIMTNASRIINREIRKERKAGLEQGIQQGIALVAKKLKGKMEIKDISQITGLSETEIENL